MCKWQRRDFCEEFTVWYLATKCATENYISKARNVEPLLRIEIFQLRWFGRVSRMSQENLASQVLLLPTPTGKRLRGWPEPGGLVTSPAPALMWRQQNYQGLLITMRYFESSWGCCPRDTPQSKNGYENEWMCIVCYGVPHSQLDWQSNIYCTWLVLRWNNGRRSLMYLISVLGIQGFGALDFQ